MPDLLDRHCEIVKMAARALGPDDLKLVPSWMTRLIKEDAWKGFRSPVYDKEVFYGDKEFEKFLITDWDEGLGRKDGIVGMIRICEAVGGEDAPEALRLLKQQLPAKKEHGVNQHTLGGNNVTSSKRGNSPSYSLARLKRDRPDLAAQVVNGEKSAHAAAIEAGFRRRYLQVDIDDPEKAYGQLLTRCEKAFVISLGEFIQRGQR